MISPLPRPLCKLNRRYSLCLATCRRERQPRKIVQRRAWLGTPIEIFPAVPATRDPSGQPPIEFGRNHEEPDVPEKLERWRVVWFEVGTVEDASCFRAATFSSPRKMKAILTCACPPHQHNTSRRTPCCQKIYEPYHGAASKRLFAVKRKRLIKTSPA